MNSIDKQILIGNLLAEYKIKYPQSDCKFQDCCGICDKYYSCLYYIFEELIKETKFSEKKLEEYLLTHIKNE
jgi:hypothetical protein